MTHPKGAALGWAWLVAIVVVFQTVPLVAANPGRSVDDQLLGGPQADPLDPDVERQLFSPDKPTEQPAKTGIDQRNKDLQEQLRKELGAAAVPEESNPLAEIAGQMRQSESLISRNQSGQPTQNIQRQIVSDLDRLIQQARSQCQAGKPSPRQKQETASRQSVQQPRKPGTGKQQGKPKGGPSRDSNATAGLAQAPRPGRDTMQSILEQTQTWGELPPTVREQMLELWSEEFLPKYEALIEEYFKRLAEEKQP